MPDNPTPITSNEIKRIEHTDLAERVHSILKEQIFNQKLSSGTQIVAEEFAKSLGVSRTPVQEALQRLDAEGLVEVKPRIGTFVKPLTMQEFSEIADLRENLELFAAKLAINLVTDEEVEGLRKLAGEFTPFFTEDGKRTDIAGFARKNAEFHDFHFRLANNNKLVQFYRRLNLDIIHARIYFRHEPRSALLVNEEHLAIVGAYEDRSLAALTRTISLHCRRGKKAALAVFEQTGGSL